MNASFMMRKLDPMYTSLKRTIYYVITVQTYMLELSATEYANEGAMV